jgi:hypothetical protein
MLTPNLSSIERYQICGGANLFEGEKLEKGFHLDGFDNFQCLIDLDLIWIYVGRIYIEVVLRIFFPLRFYRN